MKNIVYLSIILLSVFLVIYCVYGCVSYSGIEKIDDNYSYLSESRAIVGKGKLVDIPPFVEKYCFDDNFVLVKQRPHYFYDEMCEYNENFEYKSGLDADYFWIVIKNKKEVAGPLTEEEFNMSIKKLNVSEKLVNTFRGRFNIDYK